ncbi:MAG: TonB-dependent receptor [Flavobacteriales bacterium]|nr:TonB-dependent receptor [Flavobacteriales bacterium]MBK8948559.1 TonB-dependent receptor [Flavobacteriales bacterium]MBK9700782.1 TonB-dependent receptor [Flavobacteriales bacterium]
MRFPALVLAFLPCTLVIGQERHTLSGYVKDAASGEALIGAGVYLPSIKKGTATNAYGYYSLTLEPGTYTVNTSYLGYGDRTITVELKADQVLNIELQPDAIIAQEVTITGKDARKNTESTDMGRAELDVQQVKLLPALLGEVDLLKTLQYLPGVKSNGEGNAGFYVRGGGPDQNLILLDEATVYNASHLFGFFSVFNADAVKNIELIKGGIPAMYGGRISSVLDISMKEGNDKSFHAQGGIGLISSRLTVEGPIVKERASFLLSGRRTYIDVITKPFIPDSSAFGGSGYYFYDVNAKVNYRLSDKDRLYLSGYFGRDVFTFANSDPDAPTFRIPWGNATVSARWNHVFGPKLFLNSTATFSDYRFEFKADQEFFAFSLFSGIKDVGLKMDLSHYASVRHTLKYGGQYIHHTYTPSTVEARSGNTDFDILAPSLLIAHEGAVYVQDEFDLTDEIRINAGLRFTGFAHVGPFDEFVLDEQGERTDTRSFSGGETVGSYFALEPRLSARYRLNERSSVKASFNRGQQYVHLASFSSIALPTDVWIPASREVKPLIGTQYAAGYFRNFLDNMIETSVEVYYKDMRNLVEYAEGAEPQANGNTNYYTQLVFGNGYSYGAELFVKKATGKLNGWIGYTWSKTMRIFPDINEGREFPSRWDRRHDLSVVAVYELNKRWNFAGTFVYATGQAATLPVNRYFVEGNLVSEYTERNGFRMAPYHRLDLAITLNNKEQRKVKDKSTGEVTYRTRRWRSSWTLSVYNVYNRANPYFIYFDNEGNVADGSLQVVAKQVSLFSILPSITWNFKF